MNNKVYNILKNTRENIDVQSLLSILAAFSIFMGAGSLAIEESSTKHTENACIETKIGNYISEIVNPNAEVPLGTKHQMSQIKKELEDNGSKVTNISSKAESIKVEEDVCVICTVNNDGSINYSVPEGFMLNVNEKGTYGYRYKSYNVENIHVTIDGENDYIYCMYNGTVALVNNDGYSRVIK